MMFLSSTTHAAEDIKGKRYEIPESGFYNGYTPKDIDIYLNKLEKAVKNDDVEAVSQLISYPLTFNSIQNSIKIKDKSAFIKIYPRIFNDTVKKAAIEGEVSEAGYRGLMVDNGTIWFDPKNGIFAINEQTK